MKTSLASFRAILQGGILFLSIFFAAVSPAFGAAPETVTWNPDENRQWDYTTPNWLSEAPPHEPTLFQLDNIALFTAAGAGAVSVRSGGVSLLHSFQVDSDADYVFQGGPISGTGGLEKTGQGRLTLAAANTYFGETLLGGGILTLAHRHAARNSSLHAFGATVEVKQTGTIVKDISLDNASILRVDVDASNVSNPALTADTFYFAPNARLAVNIGGYSGVPITYWVLSGDDAGSISGNNISINVNAPARVRRSVILENNALYVSLTASSFGALYGEWLTENGRRVTQVIDHAITMGIKSPLFQALEMLPGNSEAVPFSLNQLHAEAYVTQIAFAAQLQRDFNTRLMNWRNMVANNGYYGYADPYYITYRGKNRHKPRRCDLWATISAESMTRNRIGDYSAYNGDSCGVAAGIEWKLSSCWYGGIALGYDDASLSYRQIDADDSLRAARVSLYGGYVNSSWYTSGHVGYAKDWHDTIRRVRIPAFATADLYAPGFSADARGRYNDDVASAGIEFGKFYSCYDLNLIPTVGVNYVFVYSPGIREEDADSANLVINRASYNSLRMPVGLRANMDLALFSELVLTPEIRLFGMTEWADRSVRRTASFSETPRAGTFYSEGGGWGRNGFLFGIGLTAQCGRRITIGLNYDCESWKEHNRHVGSAFLNCRW